jgi:ABC-type transporter Mla subunit MlaD
MDGMFWVGLVGVLVIAAASIVVLLAVRARGRRLPPDPEVDRARAEAQQLREQSLRDGYIP